MPTASSPKRSRSSASPPRPPRSPGLLKAGRAGRGPGRLRPHRERAEGSRHHRVARPRTWSTRRSTRSSRLSRCSGRPAQRAAKPRAARRTTAGYSCAGGPRPIQAARKLKGTLRRPLARSVSTRTEEATDPEQRTPVGYRDRQRGADKTGNDVVAPVHLRGVLVSTGPRGRHEVLERQDEIGLGPRASSSARRPPGVRDQTFTRPSTRPRQKCSSWSVSSVTTSEPFTTWTSSDSMSTSCTPSPAPDVRLMQKRRLGKAQWGRAARHQFRRLGIGTEQGRPTTTPQGRRPIPRVAALGGNRYTVGVTGSSEMVSARGAVSLQPVTGDPVSVEIASLSSRTHRLSTILAVSAFPLLVDGSTFDPSSTGFAAATPDPRAPWRIDRRAVRVSGAI